MNTTEQLFYNLVKYIIRLYREFIEEYIKNSDLKPTDKEMDSVKAFCVLSHAAFEDFFEQIALQRIKDIDLMYSNNNYFSFLDVSNESKSNEILKKIITSFILMVGYSSKTSKKLDGKIDETNNSTSFTIENLNNLLRATSSYSKDLLEDAIKKMKSDIKESHGASLKYLLKIFVPVGIDLPKDLNYHNSLQKLALLRGEYAHSIAIANISSAKEMKDYVADCLKFCKELKNNAKI